MQVRFFDIVFIFYYMKSNISQDGGDIYEVYWSEELGKLKYQIGNGVSIDQVLGQWHADLYGLGDIFDREKTRTALSSIMKYNFREQMRDHYNPCRLFCLNDESGLVICSWPKGVNKPAIPAPYSQETMHGFEYAAADMMVRRGLVDDGLKVVKGIRDRYDGHRRNPWNEMECGSNYARSMASYALLLSYSGFKYDGRTGIIGFQPVVDDDFSYLWSFGKGWGKASLTCGQFRLSVLGGELFLKKLQLPPGSGSEIAVNEVPIAGKRESNLVIIDESLILQYGDVITAG